MSDISKTLTEWYASNKRDLPWRHTKNAYNIWVSEIILQQTRVNQGVNYYYRFIEKFPDIYSLANSDIDELLKIWQGLGYYSRAVNMHKTAKEIAKNCKGKFPDEYNELIKFKGIGDYTASAIASISFNKKTPVLDGNVFRVIARLFGISDSTQTKTGKKIYLDKTQQLMGNHNPEIFNQAVMEFGALQCVPKIPDCINCILNKVCFAYKNNRVNDLPVKKIKTKQRIRYFNYIYIKHKAYIFIEKRTKNDIWKLLYQIPLIETEKLLSIPELSRNKKWIEITKNTNPEIEENHIDMIHVLSHQIIHTRFYVIKISEINDYITSNYIKIHASGLSEYSMSVLLKKYFNLFNN
ncbi:MAG: A/G-specific adenine glycosylase [Bacteroidales bacterium]|nr:A/G-specific adenine glycosylase [Bacteroidales bacterium]